MAGVDGGMSVVLSAVCIVSRFCTVLDGVLLRNTTTNGDI
jgi:hypothetical protein